MCDFFFFQAEDGIRDIGVTGVQTCALPISAHAELGAELAQRGLDYLNTDHPTATLFPDGEAAFLTTNTEIGRASCRERVEISVVAVSVKKKNDDRASEI